MKKMITNELPTPPEARASFDASSSVIGVASIGGWAALASGLGVLIAATSGYVAVDRSIKASPRKDP